MELKKKVIYKIQDVIFKNNVVHNENNKFLLSHIIDDLFCIITIKDKSNTLFFSDKCPSNMNSFFKKILDMLLSYNLNGKGCFDYEYDISSKSNMYDKANRYFSSDSNFILIKYSHKRVEPLSIFTYVDNFIWNVCTDISVRNKGYMSILFNHFLSLVKNNEIPIIEEKKNFKLFLLKKNPNFENIKRFYEEHNFIIDSELSDKIVMMLN